jgi:RNA polymerase sigma-70 factor (ECF subfamily)
VAITRDALAGPGFLAVASDPRAEGRARPEDVEREKVATLYAEHGARIHRFLCDLLRDRALAADATQETFVRALRHVDAGRDGGLVAPWLFGIARNVSLEMRRARSRAGRVIVPSEGASGAEDGVAAGSPERDLLGREAVRIVGAALARLSEERRTMLLLRLDHGLAYEEIAATMGISLAKVKVEIFRARAVLRATLAEYREEERGAR